MLQFDGVGCHERLRRCKQVRVGAVVRTADTATQLVQLRQAEAVCPVDNDGIRRRHIEAAFNNRCAQQDVEAALVKIEHDLFKLPLRHLTVPDSDFRLGYQLLYLLFDAANILDAIVDKKHLSAALDFTQTGFPDNDVVPF